jgi:signal peptide peptidase SppA
MTMSLWLGSQTTYETVLEAKTLVQANYASRTESEVPMPDLLDVQGPVGIINITGSLVDGKAGYMSYFGVVGYGDIRDALVAAIQHQGVQAILLNISSGGGAVAGCHETAQLIARVAEIKPVVSYCGGVEASAALWLGSSAKYAVLGETAIAGSLGILMVHAERSEQLKQDGIKVTVIRAGSEKALNNPYEALTDKAKEKLQGQADTMYDIFLGHVASQRGVSITAADTKFGQGKEFIGKQAVAAGLLDSVGTFEDAYAKAVSLGAKTTKKSSKMVADTLDSTKLSANISEVSADDVNSQTSGGYNATNTEGTTMTKPLTQEQLVAMAAGVDLQAATVTKTPEELATEAAALAAANAAATAALASAATTETEKPSELVAYLQTQLKELQTENLALTASAKTATDSVAALTKDSEALVTIVRAAVKNMAVPLGGSAASVDALSASDLVAEHARVSPLFKDKFKVGGVAATTSEGKADAKATVSPFFAVFTKSHAK